MKKFISAFVSAVVGVSTMASFTTNAVETEKAPEKKGIVILGDSIASGYTRKGAVEHNYGEICGDYLGCDVYNYAKSGDDTDDMLEKMSAFSAEQQKNLADAEYVVISVGGNDIIEHIANFMLDYATKNNYFNEGYTAADIPANPTLSDITTMININGKGGLKESLMGSFTNQLAFMGELGELVEEISGKPDIYTKDKKYSGGIIGEHIVPNIQKAADSIKKVNPDAKIYVQTIYQPLQFDPKYMTDRFGDNASVVNILRSDLEDIMKSYSQQLENVKDIEIVDVKYEFTALKNAPSANKDGKNNNGYTYYFVDVQSSGSLADIDIHPNQKGHVAIAAAVLDKIGKLHEDNGLLSKTFDSFADKESYPEIPLATYKKVAGVKEGQTTTATSTTTTTTTTTTTLTTTTTSTTTTTPVAPEYKMGDVNNDGYVDAVDAAKVLVEYAKRSVGDKGSFTDAQNKAGDIDSNGMIDSVDASKILKYYAYLSSSKEENKKTFEEFVKKA